MADCDACKGRGWLDVSLDGTETPEGLVVVQRCDACNRYPTDIAAAEGRVAASGGRVFAIVCREARFRNYYRCPDDEAHWSMTWSCMCNDRCPTCNHEIGPFWSEELPLEEASEPASWR